jgi:gamma-glutamylaminecyclotransferase
MDTTTDNNDIIIAAYGTLRPQYNNNRLLAKSKHIGTGKTVEKYTLRASGIPFVSKEPLHNVVVDIYKVDNSTLEDLDSLEGHPEWYCREKIPVIVNNKTLDAWLYFNDGYSHLPIINSGDYNKK